MDDGSLKCTECQDGYKPAADGRLCLLDFWRFDGDTACVEESVYDPVIGHYRMRCKTCDAGYVWDNVTWSCTKAPGFHFCSATAVVLGKTKCSACYNNFAGFV